MQGGGGPLHTGAWSAHPYHHGCVVHPLSLTAAWSGLHARVGEGRAPTHPPFGGTNPRFLLCGGNGVRDVFVAWLPSSPQPCMRSDCLSRLSLACRSGLIAAMRRRRRGKSSFPLLWRERGREGIALPSRASPRMGKSGRDGEPPPRGAPWETANAWRSARSSPHHSYNE